MVKPLRIKPLFLGLTHIGQVYSASWAKKIGPCSIYDFNKIDLKKFKNKNFTQEEPGLRNFTSKRITFLESEREITKYRVIFFTYDTPINPKNGYPKLELINRLLKKLFSINFKKKTIIIITTQVYPGFLDKIKTKYNIKKNIQIIYMVDTLKMGEAVKSFLYPKQLIFGGYENNKKDISLIFSKFKCKKYLFTFKEAELIKISINLYLFFSVSYANILDGLGRDNKVDFSKILNVLRNDKRIGEYSYIHPSLGMAGGHLERDSFFFQKINKSKESKKILNEMLKFNSLRKNILEKEIINMIKKNFINILIIGISYKKDSFSIVNSVFSNLVKNKNFKIKIFDDQYDLTKQKDMKVIKDLNNLKIFDLIIYNYSNKINDKKIIGFLIKNKKKYLLNISFDKKDQFTGKNVKNLFSKEIIQLKK